jgi:hypothetical protein
MDTQSNKDNSTKGSWLEWAMYVLRTLQSHEDSIKELKKQETADNLEFEKFRTKIETKSTMLAVIFSIIVTVLANLLFELMKRNL